MSVLSSLSVLKTHLGISNSTYDSVLTQILNSVDAACLRFLNRGGFTSATYTEYYDGADRESLSLKHRPLTAISSVRVDAKGYSGYGTDAFPASSAWTIGVNFIPKDGIAESENNSSILTAIGGVWPQGTGNIKVVYTAGYSAIPADLQLAVNQLCAMVHKGREQGGVIGKETLGEYSYELLNGGDQSSGTDLISARSTLARYRELAV